MKVNRHAKIIELINKYHIETQEELAEYLNREGFKVTQATVSRDIRDLKLTKIPSENGKQRYALHQHHESAMSEKYIRVLSVHGYGAEYPGDQDSSGNGKCGMCGTGCNEME